MNIPYSQHHTGGAKTAFVIAVLVLLILAAGGLWYRSRQTKQPAAPAAQTTGAPVALNLPPPPRHDTFAGTAFPDFPKPLAANANPGSAQYWSGSGATGAMFVIKEPLPQAAQDYLKQLPKGWQAIDAQAAAQSMTANAASFGIINMSMGQIAQVLMSALPGNKGTSVRINVNIAASATSTAASLK